MVGQLSEVGEGDEVLKRRFVVLGGGDDVQGGQVGAVGGEVDAVGGEGFRGVVADDYGEL